MILSLIKLGVLIALLLYASIKDIKSREVPDSVSGMMLILGLVGITAGDLPSMLLGMALVFLPQYLAAIINPEKALLEMTYDMDVFEDFDMGDIESEDGLTEIEDVGAEEAVEATPVFKTVSIDKNTGLFYSNYTFKAELNPKEDTAAEDIEMDLPIDTDSFRMTFTVTMPSDITQANGATIEGNKAVFEIDDITEAQEFSVVCEQNNVVAVIVIIVVLVIVLGLFFFLTKRKG